MGFEPMLPKEPAPKAGALDHSAKPTFVNINKKGQKKKSNLFIRATE